MMLRTRARRTLVVGLLLGSNALQACSQLPPTPTVPAGEFVSQTLELPGLPDDPPASFVLLPGDIVRLKTVSVDPIEAEQIVVDEAGNVDIPLAGLVAVGGMTPAKAASAIEDRLHKFDRFARVSLTITSPAGHVATVTGAVEKPGAVLVRPDLRLAELLATVGGPKSEASGGELADLADVDGARVVRDGAALPVSLGAAMRGETHHNVRIRPGDVIYIPPSRGRMITVMGEVGAPKAFAWRSGMRLTTALALAGGIARSGDSADVRVVRGKLSAPTVYRTDIAALFRGDGGDVELAPGDVIYVGADAFWTVTEVLGRIMPALAMASLVSGFAK